MTDSASNPTPDPTAPASAETQAVRDIAEVPAVEIITSTAVHLMSAAAVKVGLAEDTPEQLPPDHPHAAHLDVYHWLTVMQDLLVEALM